MNTPWQNRCAGLVLVVIVLVHCASAVEYQGILGRLLRSRSQRSSEHFLYTRIRPSSITIKNQDEVKVTCVAESCSHPAEFPIVKFYLFFPSTGGHMHLSSGQHGIHIKVRSSNMYPISERRETRATITLKRNFLQVLPSGNHKVRCKAIMLNTDLHSRTHMTLIKP